MIYIKPQESDVLGDRWANHTNQVWQRMTQLDPELCRQPHAYSVWQWTMCQLADMNHRVVASPEAIAIAAAYKSEPAPDVTTLLDALQPLSDRAVEIVTGKFDSNQQTLFEV